MTTISYTFYYSVSVNSNVVEIHDDITYNVVYLSFIDEIEFAEVTAHNSVKSNIECLPHLYFYFRD